MTDAAHRPHPDRSFPRLHPRPASGWVNDPNGILYSDGRWHVFFQYNPASARHADICWGHVSSTDLLSWEEHPIALRPREAGPDALGCWSGVALLDDGVPTIAYSGGPDRSGLSPAIVVRGSTDAVEWGGERVVAAPVPTDPAVVMVRDPFVFRLGGRRWAVQGAGLTGGGGALLLYAVDDLEEWVECGLLLTAADGVAADLAECDGWECPQLVRSGDDWVLLVSLWMADEPHRGVASIVGSLDIDAETGLPVFSGRATGVVDAGHSFYAPQAVQAEVSGGTSDRVLLWGWAQESSEGGTGRSPEDSDAVGWSGLLTFPRELTVRDDVVEIVPARELDGLRAEPVDAADLPDQAEVALRGSGSVELRIAGPADRVLWQADLDGDDVRILIDASIVEIHRAGRPPRTLRAHPGDGERFSVRHGDGVSAEAWALRLPAER